MMVALMLVRDEKEDENDYTLVLLIQLRLQQ